MGDHLGILGAEGIKKKKFKNDNKTEVSSDTSQLNYTLLPKIKPL